VSLNGKIKIYISKNIFKIILLPSEETQRVQSDSDNKFIGEVVFLSDDMHCLNNILIVTDKTKKYHFKKSNSDILIAQSNMNKYIKKGDRFFCSNYRFQDKSTLSGYTWKNNKKDGDWILMKNDESYVYTFRNGKVVRIRKVK
jgi:hypothetical protein